MTNVFLDSITFSRRVNGAQPGRDNNCRQAPRDRNMGETGEGGGGGQNDAIINPRFITANRKCCFIPCSNVLIAVTASLKGTTRKY